MHRGTGIYVHQQTFTDLKIGDTFFDADYGDMIWNGTKWQSNHPAPLVDPKVGDLVHYIPFEGCSDAQKKNGIIKWKTNDIGVAVVYRTDIAQLRQGWIINLNNNEDETFIEE
jgi:hypothetical protein